jgi:hypothetical protein
MRMTITHSETRIHRSLVRSLGMLIAFGVAFPHPASARMLAGMGMASTTVSASKSSTAVTKLITRADSEIDRRTTSLTTLASRVASINNVSASQKSSIQATVNTEETNLSALKSKIDADSDLTTLKSDVKSITEDYRIYALILPQGHIAAASDRVLTMVSMFTSLGSKFDARITADQAAGKNVTAAQSALADMRAKAADAATQANAAITATANLTPDQGSTTLSASNKAALKGAEAHIKTATSDLKAARADVTTITKSLKITTSASAGTSGSGTTASASASATQ